MGFGGLEIGDVFGFYVCWVGEVGVDFRLGFGVGTE